MRGVRYRAVDATAHSLAMRSRSGTILNIISKAQAAGVRRRRLRHLRQ